MIISLVTSIAIIGMITSLVLQRSPYKLPAKKWLIQQNQCFYTKIYFDQRIVLSLLSKVEVYFWSLILILKGKRNQLALVWHKFCLKPKRKKMRLIQGSIFFNYPIESHPTPLHLLVLSSVTSKKPPNVHKSCPKVILLVKLKILRNLQKLPKMCWHFGQNNCCHGLWKVAQSPINRRIWSHWF